MAPHADSPIDDEVDRLPPPPRPAMSLNPPRLLIIGAGSRGTAYARATGESTNGILVAVAEPIFLTWEQEKRAKAARGEDVLEGVDSVFICVLDKMHKEVIVRLAPLGFHIMCEKLLVTSFVDCVLIYKSLLPDLPNTTPSKIFSIGYVLRYSLYNMLLKKLLLEDRVIGDIMSVNYTKPVFPLAVVSNMILILPKGNWRKEFTTAPSLLTKSCHDIDLLLWLLCSPLLGSANPAHIPTITRKPKAVGQATNCLSCLADKKHSRLGSGNTFWPVNIVLLEIEEYIAVSRATGGEAALTAKLTKDYTSETPDAEVSVKNWFGRSLLGRGAKTAVFHIVAHTKKQYDRYSHFYRNDNFNTRATKIYKPHLAGGRYSGSNNRLVRQFIFAINAHVGCSLEEVIRSSAIVFAAEQARLGKKVLDFPAWWSENVEASLVK
ncbi:hypothetical protein DL98DRAFT_564674 [Cadophora sp. DSE1049]|nr:hypothetical protein DL98DRAFT_564674 [Cadophora sp. DSE1049]